MLRHEEQHTVGGVRGRVHGLREHRRRSGDYRGGEFGYHNAEVRDQGNYDGTRTLVV
jgi:hypothetical protein